MIPSDRNDQDRDLDRLLLNHLGQSAEPLTPSSGFTQSVMDTIREQSVAPEPIPFPWKRFAPFALAVLCILVAFVVALFIFGTTQEPPKSSTPSLLSMLSSTTAIRVGSIVSAIVLCYITAIASIRLIMGRA